MNRVPSLPFRFGLSLALLSMPALAPLAHADTIQITASAAGVQAPSSTSFYETFNNAAVNNGTLTTTFGNSGITGTYSGNGLAIEGAGLYGGAGGSGRYIAATDGGSYTLNLSQGVNYFGLWDSALDLGNQISFYNGSTLVYTFTPNTFVALVGACPSSTSGYCGNPNLSSNNNNNSQQYAYLNFYDTNGTFNSIVFSEAAGDGEFESDNHAVANLGHAPGGLVIAPVPEPASLLLLCTGLAGGVQLLRRHAANSAGKEVQAQA